MSTPIGVMGMGIMGRAMAANLLQAGHPVTVFNRSRSASAPLEEKGASVAESPAALGRECRIVIVMLTGPEAIDALLWQAAEAMAPGSLVINMSTVPPAYARATASRLEAQGLRYLDAPVSGSRKPAEEGSLVILAGGDGDTLKEAGPIFDVLGKKTVHCGAVGQGSMMKMAVNLLLGVMMEGYAEMIQFGLRGGLPLETMQAVVANGPLNNGLFQLKEQMFRDDSFPAQFPLKHMAKDMRFLDDTAAELGSVLPCAASARERYARGEALGLGEQDFAAVVQVLDVLSKENFR
jgi:3-hydroxyisobutyrate dehydrogenase-like beta-hydroxyacid dehydrogenase